MWRKKMTIYLLLSIPTLVPVLLLYLLLPLPPSVPPTPQFIMILRVRSTSPSFTFMRSYLPVPFICTPGLQLRSFTPRWLFLDSGLR